MPSADLRRDRLSRAALYLCTDARRERGGLSELAEFAEAAISGGVDVIQLRDKGSAGERELGPLEAVQELEALRVLGEVCRRFGALLAVNDRADLAFAAGADILHLGQDDLPVTVARQIVGADLLIGRSTHDTEQAAAAAAESGVDYFCTGPCWPTPTKPGRPAPGLQLVRSAAELNQRRPWFAIGGIDAERIDEVVAAGATRVVVVRAITEADDPRGAARDLKRRLPAG
jgi:thiamine-phosphate pyrophosphorylase